MLFLLFQLGKNRYALDIGQVAEVLPWVTITPLPRSPPEVAGVFNYGGAPVPVVDLCQLTLDRPARRLLSTRVVVMHYADESGAVRLLGLIAEGATETLRCDPARFCTSGVGTAAAGALGPVALDEQGVVQRVDLNGLLPASVRKLLFQQTAER